MIGQGPVYLVESRWRDRWGRPHCRMIPVRWDRELESWVYVGFGLSRGRKLLYASEK